MPQGSAASCLRRPPPPSCHQAAVQGAGPYEATSIYSPSGLPPAASPALSGLLRHPPHPRGRLPDCRGAGYPAAASFLLQRGQGLLPEYRWRLAQGRAFVSCTPVCTSLGGVSWDGVGPAKEPSGHLDSSGCFQPQSHPGLPIPSSWLGDSPHTPILSASGKEPPGVDSSPAPVAESACCRKALFRAPGLTHMI